MESNRFNEKWWGMEFEDTYAKNEETLKKHKLDEKRKSGKLKPAMQRHNIKQAKVWQTKVPRRGVK